MKKGSIELSFGMIFSIIVVIAIVAVAFYAIRYFLELGECTEIGLFYNDLQEEVDRAWRSEIARDTFEGSLPSGIELVCMGDLSGPGSGTAYQELRRYRQSDSNLFLYPLEEACDVGHITVEHVDFSELDGFTCFPVERGDVRIGLEKGSFDTSVKIVVP